MAREFNGTIETDIRDSKEDWAAYTQASPPEGSPNVVILLWDDTGLATWDFYGGLVEMPNMKRIVRKGIRYTGGTIQKVVVDVSGDHYVDLEMEAMAAMKRD